MYIVIPSGLRLCWEVSFVQHFFSLSFLTAINLDFADFVVTHCSLQAKARVLFGEESRLPCFCLLCILSSLLRMVFHLQPVQATMKDWLLCELGIAVNFLNLKVNKLNILGYLLVTTCFSASLHCNSSFMWIKLSWNEWIVCYLFR